MFFSIVMDIRISVLCLLLILGEFQQHFPDVAMPVVVNYLVEPTTKL